MESLNNHQEFANEMLVVKVEEQEKKTKNNPKRERGRVREEERGSGKKRRIKRMYPFF